MNTPNKITIAELLEIPVGQKDAPSWVNDEFEAVLSNIIPAQGKGPTKCTLSDPDNSSIRIIGCFFGGKVITRYENKLCLFGGQGMSRTEFNGTDQLTMGAKVTINVLAEYAQNTAPAPRAASTLPGQSGNYAGNHDRSSTTPAIVPINGQTVGMAVKEALTIVREDGPDWSSPVTWKAVHEVASDIIRLSRLLEMGKLAAPVRERADPDHAAQQKSEREEQAEQAEREAEYEAQQKAEALRKRDQANREANMTDNTGGSYGEDEVPF